LNGSSAYAIAALTPNTIDQQNYWK